MPIYMDRHDVSETVTAENVAQLHQQDLKIQHLYNCKGLTYWFDAKRKTAFCLVDAPNKEAIKMMHDNAHGDIPHRIIEVDDAVVESFLGRIEDPKKSQKTELNIINDPAFRTLLVIGFKRLSLNSTINKLNLVFENHGNTLVKKIHTFNGSIVKQKSDYILASFDSVTNAVLCAINIQMMLKLDVKNTLFSDVAVNMGLSAGVPVTEKENIFEDTIKTAERLCFFVKGQLVMTSEVKDLYESENLNISIDEAKVYAISLTDEKFLNIFLDCIDREWRSTTLNIDRFIKDLGCSKSKLYRSIIPLTGKSPNTFLKEYRLNKALQLLRNQMLNISEIAYESGFNSPAYFSKEFKKQFGLLPKSFIKGSKAN